MYVRIGTHSLRKCYTQLLGAYPKYAHTHTKKRSAAARQGLTLGFAYLMPDYWLEVSLRPATSIKVLRGYLGPTTNAKLVPKLHVALPAPVQSSQQ
jgi:hypothetical protein